MKIYICMASQGEYSDRVERILCAFNNEEKAQKYILNAQKFLTDIALKLKSEDKEWWELEWSVQENLLISPFDKKLDSHATDPTSFNDPYYPRYYLEATELLGLPEDMNIHDLTKFDFYDEVVSSLRVENTTKLLYLLSVIVKELQCRSNNRNLFENEKEIK